ncbi:hypothetical protein GGI24_002362 [Coemansia furcata]|nr:hypothetical protein GGI24_002362 [Coemansia furcata]
MPDMNDLPEAVLKKILRNAAATPAKTLAKWKTKLPLLAVCRAWTDLVIGAVFDQVYVELFEACPHCDPPMVALFNNNLTLSSNAGLLISRNCTLMARRLKIELADRTTPYHLLYIAVVILKLYRVDWMSMNTLTITDPRWACKHTFNQVTTEETSTPEVALAVSYFVENMRNIVEINLVYPFIGFVGEHFVATLVSAYGRQLQVLRARNPNSFPISILSRNIQVLELDLDLLATPVLPIICGKHLKVLKLDNVPRNFAWHNFRYDMNVRPIVFLQLTILHLAFKHADKALTERELQDKVASGAYNWDKLEFPSLRELEIRNCTPDCNLLYTDHSFPELNRVYLSGSIDGICYCMRLKLSWVRDLHVSIYQDTLGDTAEIYRATNHFFSDIFIGRTATLIITEKLFVLDPEQMRWINLTQLLVDTVNHATVCRAIGRLPNLCGLTIEYLEFDSLNMDGFSTDASLFVSVDPMLAWGEKLATLTIRDFHEKCSLAVYVGCIQALISHAGALCKLVVLKSARQPIAMFINSYKDCYPHLARIQLLD